jgi:hypothetical protein
MPSRIMYMECKGIEPGEARIARVSISQFNRVISYQGRTYQPHTDRGNRANYYEVGSGTWYWFANCQKDGMDSLEPKTVIIDEDVQKEYWEQVRKCPDKVGTLSYQSPGKHG